MAQQQQSIPQTGGDLVAAAALVGVDPAAVAAAVAAVEQQTPRVWSAVPDGEQPGMILAGRIDRIVPSTSRGKDGKPDQHRLVVYGDLVMLDSSRKPIPVRERGEQQTDKQPRLWRESVTIPAGVMHRLCTVESIPQDESGKPTPGSREWQQTVAAIRQTALRHGLRGEYRLPASVEASGKSGDKPTATPAEREAALADLLAATD